MDFCAERSIDPGWTCYDIEFDAQTQNFALKVQNVSPKDVQDCKNVTSQPFYACLRAHATWQTTVQLQYPSLPQAIPPTVKDNTGALVMTLIVGSLIGAAVIAFLFARYVRLPFGIHNPFLKKYIGEEVDRLQKEKEGYTIFEEAKEMAEAKKDFETFKKQEAKAAK